MTRNRSLLMNNQTIHELDEIIRLNPEDAVAYINRGDAYHRKGEYDLAIMDYTEAIRLHAEDTKVYTKRGFIYVKRGQYDLAIADYSEAVRIDPKCVEAYRTRGDVYLVKREYDLAFADYDQAKGGTKDDVGRRKIDLDWGAIADYTEVIWWEIRDLDKAIRRDPQDAIAYNNRGDIYYEKLHNRDAALEDYDEAIRLNPDYAIAYINRGNIHQDEGEYDLAIANYNEAIKLNPDEGKFYYERGIAYSLKGEYDQAIADFDEGSRLDPSIAGYLGSAEPYYNRGVSYYNKGEYNRAITDLSQAIKLSSGLEDATLYLWRGSAYTGKGEYDLAIEDYSETIRLDPQNAIAYNNRGYTHFEKGKYDKTIADCSEAIRHNFEDVWITYNIRGRAYLEKGEYDKAIADFDESIKIEPENPILYNNRGHAYVKRADWSSNQAVFSAEYAMDLLDSVLLGFNRALADLSEAIRLESENAILYLNRGSIYHAAIGDGKGEYKKKAVEDYDNAVRLCPNYENDFINGKFVLVYGKESIEKAIKLLNSIVSDPPESSADFYYTGVQALFRNDGYSAELAFQIALLSDYDGTEKIQQHRVNLKNRN